MINWDLFRPQNLFTIAVLVVIAMVLFRWLAGKLGVSDASDTAA